MIQQLPAFKSTSWKKFLFLICIVLGVFFRGNAQNYVDVSLKQIDNGVEQSCPPGSGFIQDLVIAPNSGVSGKGIGWGANLYLKSEAGGPNTIFDLIWLVKSNMTYAGTIYTFDNLDIWMYEYSGVSFPSFSRPDVQAWSSGIPLSGVSNLVKVVSKGKLVVKDAGSECITSTDKSFDIPYNYSGNNNLVIYLEKSTPALVSTGSSTATPLFEHNIREGSASTRRLCNWEGTALNPLNPTAINNAKNKFARVVFNSSHTNTPINVSCSTTDFLNSCIPPACTTPAISNKTTTLCSNSPLNFTPTATSTDVIPSGTSYKWTFTDNPNVTGEANETIGKMSISPTSNLINTTNTPQDVLYTVTPTSSTCVGTPFTLIVTVNPTPKISPIIKSICSGQKFDTIPSASAPNIIPNSTNYTWTVTNDPDVTANGTSIPDVTSGKSSISSSVDLINVSSTSQNVVYNVIATSGEAPNQCTSTFKVNITINPKPAAPFFTITSQPTCNANGITQVSPFLAAPAVYTFTPSSNISIDAVGKISAASGKYKILVKKDGCSSDSSDLLTMDDVPGKPVLSGADTICMANNLTLKAWTDNTKTTASTPNATNPWVSSDATIATVSNLGVVSSLNKSGKVRITYTDNANCTQFDSIVVASKAVSGTTSFTVDTICESISKSIVLSGFTPSYTIQWQDSIAGSGVWNDIPNEKLATFNTPTSLVPGNYFYRAVVKNTFCSLNDISISKLVKVVVTSISTPTFANTDIIQPTCHVATGGVTSKMQYAGVWTIKATADPLSTGVTKDTSANVLITPFVLPIKGLRPGKYTFQVVNTKGCISNGSSQIVINPQPTIPAKPVLDPDIIYCSSNSYTMDQLMFKPKPNSLVSESIKYYDKNGVVITNPKLVTMLPNVKYKFLFNNGICTSKDTLITNIPMDNGPTLPLSGGDIPIGDICAISKPIFNTLFSKLPSIDTSKYAFFISPNSTGTPILLNNATIGFNGGIKQTMYYTLADKKNGCKNNTFAKLEFKLDEGPKNLILKGTQLFCGFSNPTVAKLDTAIVTKTNPANSLVWYSSETAVTPLPRNTPLVDGFYFAAEKPTAGCESVLRKQVLATIENFGPTTLDPTNIYTFCKGSNKTIADLPNSPYTSANLVWLDANKKAITDKTISLLQGTYYAAEFKNSCVSNNSQAIDVKFESSPILKLLQLDTIVCPGGNINFLSELSPSSTSASYQWFVNDVKVGANSAIYWSKILKNKDKITLNVTSKDFCPSTANLYVRMDSLRLSMQLPSMLYVKAPAINLVGYPVGGTFSGKGITTNKLDPSVVGVGSKLVTYSFKNANNCAGEITQKVLVYDTVSNNCHVTTYDTVKVADTVSVLKVKFKLTTGIKANQETTMRVYPNPTSDILRIEVADEKAMAGYAYKIIDAAGKVIYNQPVKAAVTEIPLKTLGAVGAYFLEVLDENFKIVVSKKIILE